MRGFTLTSMTSGVGALALGLFLGLSLGCTKSSKKSPPPGPDLLSLSFPQENNPSAITLDQLPKGLFGLKSIQTLVVSKENVKGGFLHTFTSIGDPHKGDLFVAQYDSSQSVEKNIEPVSKWNLPAWIDGIDESIYLRGYMFYWNQVFNANSGSQWHSEFFDNVNSLDFNGGANILSGLSDGPSGKYYYDSSAFGTKIIILSIGSELQVYGQYRTKDGTVVGKFTYVQLSEPQGTQSKLKSQGTGLPVKKNAKGSSHSVTSLAGSRLVDDEGRLMAEAAREAMGKGYNKMEKLMEDLERRGVKIIMTSTASVRVHSQSSAGTTYEWDLDEIEKQVKGLAPSQLEEKRIAVISLIKTVTKEFNFFKRVCNELSASGVDFPQCSPRNDERMDLQAKIDLLKGLLEDLNNGVRTSIVSPANYLLFGKDFDTWPPVGQKGAAI